MSEINIDWRSIQIVALCLCKRKPDVAKEILTYVILMPNGEKYILV